MLQHQWPLVRPSQADDLVSGGAGQTVPDLCAKAAIMHLYYWSLVIFFRTLWHIYDDDDDDIISVATWHMHYHRHKRASLSRG
jgi:hypothetical protein